jgi:hypothetical protein
VPEDARDVEDGNARGDEERRRRVPQGVEREAVALRGRNASTPCAERRRLRSLVRSRGEGGRDGERFLAVAEDICIVCKATRAQLDLCPLLDCPECDEALCEGCLARHLKAHDEDLHNSHVHAEDEEDD